MCGEDPPAASVCSCQIRVTGFAPENFPQQISGAVETVAEITEAGENVFLGVEGAIERAGVDGHIGMGLLQRGDALGEPLPALPGCTAFNTSTPITMTVNGGFTAAEVAALRETLLEGPRRHP